MTDLIQPDIVVVNGDICEGTNYRSNGTGNWTNDLAMQMQTARELLEMIDCDVFIGTQGSGYHTGKNPSLDQKVIEQMDGQFGVEKFLNLQGIRFHLRHATPFSSDPRSQPARLGRDMANAVTDEAAFGHVDVFVRSHLHRFSSLQTCGQLGVITPGWKARDDFVKERNLLNADIGFVLFNIKNGSYTWQQYVTKLPRNMIVDEYTM